MKTVGELRSAIAELPDDAPILVKPTSDYLGIAWNFNTREVNNAYMANDDRYEQRRVLLIELGEFSPY